MRTKAKVAIVTGVAVAAAGLTTLALQRSAVAQGALQAPASRTYACYTDGRTSGDEIKPKNAACARAVAAGGTQPLRDWYGVLRSDGGGRTRGFIPDGKLCSGGFAKYAAYDAPSADWPATLVRPGAEYDFVYGAGAPHPGAVKLYVTKDGYNPTMPLTWADLEEQPFLTADPRPAAGDGAYRFSGSLPGKSGRHLIYSVWQGSDGRETFYGCSDVIFTASAPPQGSAAPSAPSSGSPSPSPSPGTASPISCSGDVKLEKSWPGGFQGSVTITNTGSAPINEWFVQWTMMPMDAKLTQAWDGTHMQSGPIAMIHAEKWNRRLEPGASMSAGFLGKMPGATPPAISEVSCG
ncbi:lytic polysaccharide monooxygenase [Sphaerisporangium sp. TRM90804]|uniref:lytic polysaccharide monooxygenase auxiliary activity family 9 protein n=1 Tax=Sphaerisporangium sp. TRM90804 TaxID=3031113 RepID=UPI00244D4D6F|nr:lytic polysaccharide monooxygenase [Sphaerisporangium sp. TRM90804]MDH2430244.1 lytic polysaccharide monooxygenase [Sphaerisporangium sp. TRM90804]